MAYTEFNRSKVTYTDAGSTVVFADVPMTSFSLSGGARGEIDISTSAGRFSLAGHRTPRRITIGMLFEDPTLAELETAMLACASGTLLVEHVPCSASPTDTTFIQDYVWLVNYDITGTIDGVMEVNVEFLIDETR